MQSCAKAVAKPGPSARPLGAISRGGRSAVRGDRRFIAQSQRRPRGGLFQTAGRGEEFPRSPEFARKDEAEDLDKAVQGTTQETTQETAQEIIRLIIQNPNITRQKMAETLGISGDGVKYHLRKMQEKNVIRRVGPTKGGHWEVVR